MQPIADRPLVDLTADFAVPRLEAKIVVDHQRHARRFGKAGNFLSLLEGGRQRLLANDRYSAPHSFADESQMRIRSRDDIDEVRSLRIEHLCEIGVVVRDAVADRGGCGRRRIRIANGRQDDVVDSCPSVEVKLAEVTRADGDALECIHTSSTVVAFVNL